MARRQDSSPLALVVWMLLASLLLHLVFWPIGDSIIAIGWDAPPLPGAGGWMDVNLVDEPEEEPPAPDEAKEKRRETDPPGQLVKPSRVVKEERPEDSKYVSEFDQKVAKETRAPSRRPEPGGSFAQPGDAPDANGRPMTQGPQVPEGPLPLLPGLSNTGEGSHREGAPVSPGPQGTLPLDPGRAAPAGRPGLRGSQEAMKRALGGGSYDKIDDVDQGDETLLNSRRWKYASFFNRIRDAVAKQWHPETVHGARDPDGSRYGTGAKITRLLIRLNPDGSVNKIQLEKSSGLDFLDEEAIRAVRAAQPFNNPPPQLVDPDTGFIDFGFGFNLEVEKGAGQIFRFTR